MICKVANNPSLSARYGDRAFTVTAICTTAAEALTFIAANPSHEVVGAIGEFILLADTNTPSFKAASHE
jgi:hypothetical protein